MKSFAPKSRKKSIIIKNLLKFMIYYLSFCQSNVISHNSMQVLVYFVTCISSQKHHLLMSVEVAINYRHIIWDTNYINQLFDSIWEIEMIYPYDFKRKDWYCIIIAFETIFHILH